MPLNFNPQQQPPGWLDGLDQSLHGSVKYALASLFVVGAYFFGMSHPQIPLALLMGVALIAGLLAVALFVNLIKATMYALVVVAVAYGSYLLLNDAAAKQRPAAPIHEAGRGVQL